MVPGINLGFDTTNDPAAALFTTRRNFPGASAGAAHRRARALRAADRAGRRRHRPGGARRRDQPVRRVRSATARAARWTTTRAFVQDSWRVTPTLTLNAGLRWDVQMPFTPVNDMMSAVTLADVCGMSGIGRRRHLQRAATSTSPARPAARCREFIAVDERHQRLQHRLEQHRAERRRGVAAERAERLAAHAARRSRAGDAARRLLGRLRAPGPRRVHRHVRRQPGQHAQPDARREHRHSCRPGESWPVLLRETGSALPRAVPRARRRYPIALAAEPRRRHQRVPSGHPGRVARILDGRLPARDLARTWRSKSATSARAASTSGRRSTTTSATIIENGFLDEFRLAMANLQANNARGVAIARARSPTSDRAPARRRCRSTSRTSTARRDADNPGGVHGGTRLDEHGDSRHGSS